MNNMWFYVAILSSLIAGVFVILSKRTLSKVSPAILFWVTLTIATPLLLFFAFKDGIPNLNVYFFVGVIGSVIFYTLSKILSYRVIKDVPISQVYPLISLSPIVTLIVAFLPPLSERPSTSSLIGVLVSLVGAYVLNISSFRKGLLEPFKILFKNKQTSLMLISVFAIGLVSAFDKIAINGTYPQNEIFALFFENVVVIFFMSFYLFPKRKEVFSQVFANKWSLLLLGILLAVSSGLGFVSIAGGSVGVVAALFRTKVLFTLLFSFIFFKDKPKLETIIGSIIMILGIVLIKIGS